MTHSIFLIHGMGNQDGTWADEIIHNLKVQYGEYSFSKELPFDGNFEFVSILYNNLFDEYLQAWREHSKNLKDWTSLVVPAENEFVNLMTRIASSGS
mgnify:CR=1 FL=1